MSEPIAFHVMHSLRGRRVVFPTLAQRADAYRRAQRIGVDFGLAWFNLGSDHIHSVVLCSRRRAARWANSIESSWKQGVGLEANFAPYHAKAVTDQGHLEKLFDYVIDQSRRHGFTLDPDHLGSTGPDLCGGRLVGAAATRLARQHLPRLRRLQVERLLLGGHRVRTLQELGAAPAGLAGEPLEEVLRSAAAAAIGSVDLPGRTDLGKLARRALLDVATESPLRETVRAGRLLQLSRSAVDRLRRRPVDARALHAVRWQVAFHLTRRALPLSGEERLR